MKLITFISAGIFIVLAGFILKKEDNLQQSLHETKWLLRKIHTEAGVQEVSTKAFLKFDKEKNSAGGNGSCNSFGSSTTVKGSEISFSNIFSTKMYCEGVQQTENAYLQQLGKANRFEVKDKTLSIYSGDGLLLEFVAESK